MKSMQTVLRLLVLVGSLGGFFGGWALIAHAAKPAPVQQPVQVPANDVAPAILPPLKFDQPSPLQPLPRSSLPRLRTRGS